MAKCRGGSVATRRRVISRALFDPPPFQPEKLAVLLAAGTTPLEPAPPLRRKYTLTHNDITGNLRLTIGPEYNEEQISGFYTRLLRDEVVAEWVNVGSSAFALHVYCHVSGEERWLAPPLLRNYIFRREMPLVLDTLVYADRQLLSAQPALAQAQVYVHFQSSVKELDTVEFWGVLGDRSTWPKGPTSILLRMIYAVVGWPPSLSAQPADLSIDLPSELRDLQQAVALQQRQQLQRMQQQQEELGQKGQGVLLLPAEEWEDDQQQQRLQERQLVPGVNDSTSTQLGRQLQRQPGGAIEEEVTGVASTSAAVAEEREGVGDVQLLLLPQRHAAVAMTAAAAVVPARRQAQPRDVGWEDEQGGQQRELEGEGEVGAVADAGGLCSAAAPGRPVGFAGRGGNGSSSSEHVSSSSSGGCGKGSGDGAQGSAGRKVSGSTSSAATAGQQGSWGPGYGTGGCFDSAASGSDGSSSKGCGDCDSNNGWRAVAGPAGRGNGSGSCGGLGPGAAASAAAAATSGIGIAGWEAAVSEAEAGQSPGAGAAAAVATLARPDLSGADRCSRGQQLPCSGDEAGCGCGTGGQRRGRDAVAVSERAAREEEEGAGSPGTADPERLGGVMVEQLKTQQQQRTSSGGGGVEMRGLPSSVPSAVQRLDRGPELAVASRVTAGRSSSMS